MFDYNISETVQAMPIKFAVKIVRLKVYNNLLSLMTLLFTQGHNCISNWTICLTCSIIAISRTVFKLWQSTCHDGRHMHGTYAHARFDHLDLDARSQWVGKGRKSVLNYLDN